MEDQEFALPILEQRLEKSLRLGPFLEHVEKIINQPISDDEDDDSDSEIFEEYLKDGLPGTDEEKHADRAFMYNFSSLKKSRLWLKEVLISSSESDSDEELTNNDLMDMIREHKLRKKHQSQFYQKGANSAYMYYSSGVLSRVDRYPEHQKFLAVNKRKKEKEKKEKKEEKRSEVSKKQSLKVARGSSEDITGSDFCDESNEEVNLKVKSKASKKEKKPKKLDAQALAIRRHKLWVLMAKKEVGKCQKSKSSTRKEFLQNCKKMAAGCMRHCRQKALQSQKTVKDKVWLLKRLTRTMQTEWKKFDRIMKEQNKRAEREAEEQRKIDKEILEAKRQQRKMNFLITLPELYSHFMKNKLNSNLEADEGTYSILKQLEDEKPLPASVADDYDCEAMKAQALKTAKDAYSSQVSRVNIFGDMQNPLNNVKPKDYGQPSIFSGQLKSYQLKGMNWLANLYYFGINGILADEMGLGKTVQSVAFLGHICEEYDTWGPFLIVTPASTLHNWNCEISRFVPIFKVVPYWGNPEERKNLRKFFDGKNLGTREASFHLVVTSYQIVIQDFKFLNRLKWNYMILDEAQAIKSINSQRWKQLLGFSCRNRLLLSGTPIQNSMAELWALLHFIMPTLFDSHNWFNEWFSKDIEGHVENKTTVDEKHLNRLHLILKPFMLRRVKTEVENELSDKIEIMMYCPLTLRQKYLYDGLKNKISIDELLRSSMNNQTMPSVTTSLMNLVMQFRKVCNHPELLERREVKSAFNINPLPFVLPKLVYREALLQHSLPSRNHQLQNMFSIFHPDYIFSSLEKENIDRQLKCFSFLKFVDTSVGELSKIALEGILIRWILYLSSLQKALIRRLNREWGECHIKPAASTYCKKDCRLIDPRLSSAEIKTSEVLSNLVFTSTASSTLYSFTDHIIHSVPETLPHRLIRSKKLKNKVKIEEIFSTYDDVDIKQEPMEDYGTYCTDVLANIVAILDNPKSEDVSPSKVSTSVGLAHSRIPRKSNSKYARKMVIKSEVLDATLIEDDTLVAESIHIERDPIVRICQPTYIPTFLLHTCPKAHSLPKNLYVYDRSAAYMQDERCRNSTTDSLSSVMFGSPQLEDDWRMRHLRLHPPDVGGIWASYPKLGWNNIIIPDKHTLIMDAGKLYVLDSMLCKLKAGGHRVLIYSQMTKMIDLLEEYMWHRKHKYMRLDGSSKISDRRDMVEDFQNKSDIFVFLLSTRAGGVGINLTAADTVIFYDSDWNPTVDQQAMDRAHRLGQTKQVTVYRLICKSTIEERILQRAREKSEIQRMVISGGNFKPDTLKPKEVVSLLLDDDIEKEYRAKQAERRYLEETKLEINREKMRERMRKRYAEKKLERAYEEKRRRLEDSGVIDVCGDETPLNSCPPSPAHSDGSFMDNLCSDDETNDSSSLNVLDVESNSPGSTFSSSTGNDIGQCGQLNSQNLTPSRRHKKRGRPRGSGVRGRGARSSDYVQVVNGTASGAVSGEEFQDAINDNNSFPPGPYTANSKRGRGRPRLLPLGPGHQGFRPSPTLPVALGSSLGNTLGTFTLKDANGVNQSNFYFSP